MNIQGFFPISRLGRCIDLVSRSYTPFRFEGFGLLRQPYRSQRQFDGLSLVNAVLRQQSNRGFTKDVYW